MDVIETMLHTCMRDDNTATYGMRTLLGHSATPYGVYHANLPDNPDFSSNKKYVTHYRLTTNIDITYPRLNHGTIPRQETYQISVWGGDTTTSNEKILARIRYLLEGKHKTTNPTSDAHVHNIICEWEGPELYDSQYQIYYIQSRWRVWIVDVNSVTGY